MFISKGMDNVSNQLTKLEVARRQLSVAIRLFFDDRDCVSVFTLATNAWEIVDVLCKSQNIASLSVETEGRLPEGKSLKHDFVNKPFRNFFKHADRDPDGKVSGFSDRENDHILMLATEDLLRLENIQLLECQIFQAWYLATNEERISNEARPKILPKVRARFPSIGEKSREEQKKMGREMLCRAGKDSNVIDDPMTDISELTRWKKR